MTTTIIDDVENIAPYVQYTAYAGQTVFPYPFPITATSDIVVDVNTVPTGAFSVSGVGNDTGGNVTLNTGSNNGDIVTIYRDIPITRVTQFAQNGGFSSAAFNAEFNRVYLILQQLNTANELSLNIPNTNVGNPVTMLTPAIYAGKYLAFDVNGNPTPAVLTSSGSLTQAIIASLLFAVTPVETALAITPANYAFIPFDARRFGASANITTDDSAALIKALSVAQEGFYDVPLQSWLVGGGYKIANSVLTNFAGQGQVNYKGTKVHGPSVIAPSGITTYVFDYEMDAYGQQEAVFKLEDLIVYGDGTNHPSFMHTYYTAFGEINSVHSFNGGPVLDWNYGGEMISRGCTAFGNTTGFNVYRTHDCYVTEFHAYGCSTGVKAIGLNSASQDGNVNFVNGVSHGNSTYGFDIEGLYTPVLMNVVAEVQPVNLYLKSNQYALTWGAFLGPTNAAPNYSLHYAYNGTYGNTFNITGAINAQNEMQWDACQSSIFADSVVCSVPSSITGAAISFGTSALNILSGLMVRANTSISYSYIQDVTSSNQIINGGRYEGQIYLQGTKATRGGGNIICPNYLSGGIKTDDATQGQFRTDEYVRFWDGTRINETGVGYLLPYLAQTGTLAASGGTATFDTSTLVAAPTGGANDCTEAEFMVSGGAAGSISASKVLVVRGAEVTTATILGGNGARGSFTVSVSGSVITLTNPSATANVPYTIRLTKHATY